MFKGRIGFGFTVRSSQFAVHGLLFCFAVGGCSKGWHACRRENGGAWAAHGTLDPRVRRSEGPPANGEP